VIRTRRGRRRRAAFAARGLLATALVASLALGYAFTASNTVSASNAGLSTVAITPNTLKPTECAGVNLTALVTGSGGNVQGNVGGTLIIGSSTSETLKSSIGNNCVIGGAGSDTVDVRITGGTEICIISSATVANARGCTSTTVRP
jgi:hypothetical protein